MCGLMVLALEPLCPCNVAAALGRRSCRELERQQRKHQQDQENTHEWILCGGRFTGACLGDQAGQLRAHRKRLEGAHGGSTRVAQRQAPTQVAQGH